MFLVYECLELRLSGQRIDVMQDTSICTAPYPALNYTYGRKGSVQPIGLCASVEHGYHSASSTYSGLNDLKAANRNGRAKPARPSSLIRNVYT